MTSQAPPGWYTDPSGAPGQRWWDGQSWTASVESVVTQPVVTQPVWMDVPATSAFGPAAPAVVAPSYGAATHSYPTARQSFGSRAAAQPSNRLALITFAVVALYIVIALETRLVIFGFLPLVLSMRSKRNGEPLAPVAIAAAVLAILVAAVRIFGH